LTQITLKVIDLLTFLGYRCPESYQILIRRSQNCLPKSRGPIRLAIHPTNKLVG